MKKKTNKMLQKESLGSSFADQLDGIVASPLARFKKNWRGQDEE